jgi:hypothetical protein
MKITQVIEVNYIEVVGRAWGGFRGMCKYNLTPAQVAEIGEPTRENVRKWLNPLNTGDFEFIEDFHAIVGETELAWEQEENEFVYAEAMEAQ